MQLSIRKELTFNILLSRTYFVKKVDAHEKNILAYHCKLYSLFIHYCSFHIYLDNKYYRNRKLSKYFYLKL